MKVIVTGGRNYNNYKKLEEVLDKLNPSLIIQGGATGADSLAKKYAVINDITCDEYKANWDKLDYPDARIKTTKYGKLYDAQAGHRRNFNMLSSNKDATVVAFEGGYGTKDCVKTALDLGMKVIMIE